MVTLKSRLPGVFLGSLLLTACAGNLQIPPQAADDPSNKSAGKNYDIISKSVLASGPAAPVPGVLNLSGGHSGHDGMQGMDHSGMSMDGEKSNPSMPGMQHGGHGGMSMDSKKADPAAIERIQKEPSEQSQEMHHGH